MKDTMSYRNHAPSHHPPQRFSLPTPSPPQDYDADDERTLGFDASDFTLPDGTRALDTELLKRIEDTRKLLLKLDVEPSDSLSSNSGGSYCASMKSNKENQQPSSTPDDISDGNQSAEDLDMLLEPQSKLKENLAEDCEPLETFDAATEISSVETTSPGHIMDEDGKNEYFEEVDTRIRYLESVIKTKDEVIEDLKQTNKMHIKTIRSLLAAKDSDKPEDEEHIKSRPLSFNDDALKDWKIFPKSDRDSFVRRRPGRNPIFQPLGREAFLREKKRKSKATFSDHEDEGKEDETMGSRRLPAKRPKHRNSLPAFSTSSGHPPTKIKLSIGSSRDAITKGTLTSSGKHGQENLNKGSSTDGDFWTSENQINPVASIESSRSLLMNAGQPTQSMLDIQAEEAMNNIAEHSQIRDTVEARMLARDDFNAILSESKSEELDTIFTRKKRALEKETERH